jgi:hypothetical protein
MKQRLSAAKWAELVAGWESSGLSAETFAGEHGVTEGALRWWKTELARRARNEGRRRPPKRGGPSVADSLPVAKVVRQGGGSTSGVALVIGTTRILIEKGFDGQLLREVVRALGEPR